MENKEQVLRQAGLRVTSQRLAVLEVLGHKHGPQSVDELERHPKLKSIDRSTLYRALQLFVTAGIARASEFGKGKVFYEYHAGHDHHHIVCTQCNTIEEMGGCEVDAIVERARKDSKKFSSIGTHVFELFGICKRCKK